MYEYDAVSRLRDSQLGDERVHDINNDIAKGKLWEAFAIDKTCVLLIDEIDKANIESKRLQKSDFKILNSSLLQQEL